MARLTPIVVAGFQRFLADAKLLESPLEAQIWAGFIARGLDRHFRPQVEVFERDGEFIARIDFACEVARVAVFADGHKWHDSPEQQVKDARHNARLKALGWEVRRYWTEALEPGERLDAVVDELYTLTARRLGTLLGEQA